MACVPHRNALGGGKVGLGNCQWLVRGVSTTLWTRDPLFRTGDRARVLDVRIFVKNEIGSGSPGSEILTKILTSKTRARSPGPGRGRPVREFVDVSWTSRGQGALRPDRRPCSRFGCKDFRQNEIGSGSHGLEILTKILTSKTRTLSTPRKGGRPVREFVDVSWTSRGQGALRPDSGPRSRFGCKDFRQK
jgi:hypothetical protein